MMHLLGQLGIDLPLLIAQVVNFCILLFLLWKFLYHPIIERIEADEAMLEQVQRDKEALQRETARLEIARVTREKERKRSAEATIRDAEMIAHEIRERAREEARKEKEAVISQIHARLHNVTKNHDTSD